MLLVEGVAGDEGEDTEGLFRSVGEPETVEPVVVWGCPEDIAEAVVDVERSLDDVEGEVDDANDDEDVWLVDT